MQEASSALIALEHEKGLNRFLIDSTDMKLSATLVDLYNRVVTQFIGEEANRLGRVAIIPPDLFMFKESHHVL